MYLYGSSFTLVTDHQALLCIYRNSRKTPPAPILRWAVRLQGYEFNVKYIKGSRNPADILSRNPQKAPETQTVQAEYSINQIIAHTIHKAASLQEFLLESSKDTVLRGVIRCLKRKDTGISPIRKDLSGR